LRILVKLGGAGRKTDLGGRSRKKKKKRNETNPSEGRWEFQEGNGMFDLRKKRERNSGSDAFKRGKGLRYKEQSSER